MVSLSKLSNTSGVVGTSLKIDIDCAVETRISLSMKPLEGILSRSLKMSAGTSLDVLSRFS